jgi:thymidylate kinase
VAETRAGRLIAVDGAVGRDVSEAATALYDCLTERRVSAGVSRWDASGLFTDVASAPVAQRDISPRTLLLLYAADMAFRIRWEIAPALEQGLVIVAAPYVTTAMTFGRATGLQSDWLKTLFRFAPHPSRTVIIRDRKPQRPWKRKPDRGFAESCTALLEETPERFARRRARAVMVDALAAAAHKEGGLMRTRDLRRIAGDIAKKK